MQKTKGTNDEKKNMVERKTNEVLITRGANNVRIGIRYSAEVIVHLSVRTVPRVDSVN